MKKVYVLIYHNSETSGHGEMTHYPVLHQKGTWGWDWKGYYPAFTSKEVAEDYVESQKGKYPAIEIAELELISND